MEESTLEQAEDMVMPGYKKTNWCHGWPHILRVRDNAKTLAEIVGADPMLCQMAAYFHDLGRIVEKRDNSAPELGKTLHYLDSIVPSFNYLKELGASEYETAVVVEAVTVHSNKLYYGRNDVARVLRDCDKKDAFGPWGTLRQVADNLGRDFVPTEDILKHANDPKIIGELAYKTLDEVKKDRELKSKLLEVIVFVSEWIEEEMLDLDISYDFFKTRL